MIQFALSLIIIFNGFSKPAYFEVISGVDKKAITDMTMALEGVPAGNDKNAYLGALYMKGASFQKTPKDKLQMFGKGKGLLEGAILHDANKVEYRFLRLIIQENAPKALNYSSQIREDVSFIRGNYQSLGTELRNVIVSYSVKSPNLNLKQ